MMNHSLYYLILAFVVAAMIFLYIWLIGVV